MRSFEPGDEVPFEIKVTNTGGVTLTDVVVNDPQLPACDRVIGTLAPGAMELYNCSTILGNSGGGEPVTMIYKDVFSSVSYSNNDGDTDWKGDWSEADPFGGGAHSGNVFVSSGGKLKITNQDWSYTGAHPMISRQADLSGKDSATLSFNWWTTSGVDYSDSVIVQVSSDGVNFTTLETFTHLAGSHDGSREYDISDFISDNTTIRFKIWDYYGGSNEFFKVDDVMIMSSGPGNAEGFINEACATGNGAGQTVSDCDTSEVVVGDMPGQCVSPAFADEFGVHGDGHAVIIFNQGKFVFENESGQYVENGDGTATMTGTLVHESDASKRYSIVANLSGRTTVAPAGSPKKELASNAYVENGGPVDTSTWVYYTGFDATFTGEGSLAGAVLDLDRRGPAFQIGFGASGKNADFGASMWFVYWTTSQPNSGHLPSDGNGDFNVSLNDECPDVGSVPGFTLIDAETNQVVGPLNDGDVINLNDFQWWAFTVVAETEGLVESVRFEQDGAFLKLENLVPYAAAGDSNGNFAKYDLMPGTYTLTATPYAADGANGAAGASRSVTFTVVKSLRMEAEGADLMGNFVVGNDGNASGGQYVHAPDGSGDHWSGSIASTKATFTFHVPENGDYAIKGGVHASHGGNDSFRVAVNGTPSDGFLWDTQQNTSYATDFVNDRGVTSKVTVWLNAGTHTVTVGLREDGTRLDWLELVKQ